MFRDKIKNPLAVLLVLLVVSTVCVAVLAVGGKATAQATRVPEVITNEGTDVWPDSATMSAVITDTGGGTITKCGFRYYALLQTYSFTDATASLKDGEFSGRITGLQSEIYYFVQAYAENSAGIGWGNEVKVTATNQYPAPVVYSVSPASAIRKNNQVNVTVTGDYFRQGVNLKLKNGSTSIHATSVTYKDRFTLTATFNLAATPLPVAGAWDVIASHSDGKSGTLLGGFTINPTAPSVTTINASNIATNRANLNGRIDDDGGDPAIIRSFQYREKGAAAWTTPSSAVFNSGAEFTTTVSGLSVGAAYEFRALVENDVGTSIGNVVSFTTESYLPPTVSGVTPSSGYDDQSAFAITNLAGTNLRAGATVELRKTGKAPIVATDVKVSSSKLLKCKLDLVGASEGAWDVVVTNDDGASATLAGGFTVMAVPEEEEQEYETARIYPVWYLAEGCSAHGYDTYIAITNPNNEILTADITYMLQGGSTVKQTVGLPAKSQVTVNPKDRIGAADFSTKVSCREEKSIAVDRTMVWTGKGSSCPEAHSSVGETELSSRWYIPEGSSNWGFETWTLIQNPNDTAVTCTLTYMVEGVGPRVKQKIIPANARQSFNMFSDIGAADASIMVESPANRPVVVESSVYRNNRREGQGTSGATTPSNRYYLSEGSTNWGFTTWLLIQNPNDAANIINITYMTSGKAITKPAFTIPANSRCSIKVNDDLRNADFSTTITGSLPLVAERAMYWNSGGDEVCHASIGLDSAHGAFYFPAGNGSAGFETYVLVQNPEATPVEVRITYLTATGTANREFYETIAGNSRRTFNMGKDHWITTSASVMVEVLGEGKIMCERSMYWNNRGTGTNTIGAYSD